MVFQSCFRTCVLGLSDPTISARRLLVSINVLEPVGAIASRSCQCVFSRILDIVDIHGSYCRHAFL